MAFRSLLLRLRIAWRRYRSLGQRGERAAERYLRRRGYKIVARRERGPLGELDLVAVDGRTVVFVEVKTPPLARRRPSGRSRRTRKATAAHAAGPGLSEAARAARIPRAIRRAGGHLAHAARRPTIEHFKNAFEAVGSGQMFS